MGSYQSALPQSFVIQLVNMQGSLLAKLVYKCDVSKRNAANRNGEGTVSKHIHRCGNKSLPVRVDEEVRKNGGHMPNLAQLYYDTRFNSKTKQWVHPDCEHTYQEMLRVQDEHYSTPDAQPLTKEEISKMVFKPRSGYVKGLGMRPSSSLRTPASSSSTQYI
ncbi:hypothetical protein SO802_018352 [Lithocarpus litseifolius]|uniref:Uncharacterized protein n=1 Tax=Lithocarpus litseifolius TaxID=425828 RepID=A0AAW2CPU1_9ROSI